MYEDKRGIRIRYPACLRQLQIFHNFANFKMNVKDCEYPQQNQKQNRITTVNKHKQTGTTTPFAIHVYLSKFLTISRSLRSTHQPQKCLSGILRKKWLAVQVLHFSVDASDRFWFGLSIIRFTEVSLCLVPLFNHSYTVCAYKQKNLKVQLHMEEPTCKDSFEASVAQILLNGLFDASGSLTRTTSPCWKTPLSQPWVPIIWQPDIHIISQDKTWYWSDLNSGSILRENCWEPFQAPKQGWPKYNSPRNV